ncbi:NAD(P)/FAD-dependent oxidoreductase [Cellulomonas biazotea]|uniref:Pyridine nucleotide-disulfide oxidoreductase n=1 Tax=Cellulomonas biazotea TaxID=1709 RepID=A0A402DNP4_9CELL|nr:FAD-dependent oxidoreductase [Cellulomonas biazotea]GCE75728.1 pyridine nucleotide-disulfide oxidoreductase [Cellulomonas biazotea]
MSGTVVVGAGLAAAHVVQTLRDEGDTGPITLVGEEPDRPYERPPLSKGYLQGASPRDDVFVHDTGWYDDHDVTTRFGTVAVALDRAARTVTLSDGDTLSYDHVVLATGSRPRTLDIPGARLDGVRTLRTLTDSDALRADLVAGRRLVVVGGGWIGLEVAAAARLAGLDVTVLEYAAQPLLRVLGPQVAAFFADLHRRHGVDLRTGVGVEGFEGTSGRVIGVRAGGTVIPADLVLVGVGAAPNVALARAAGLAADDRGVAVDEHLRTADPAVLAAGDVALAHHATLGHALRVEHWDNAIRQGALAARSILGRPDVYDWQPYFYTDQYDLGMEYVGHADSDDEVIVRGDPAGGEVVVFWLRDGIVRAAMNVNVWDVNDRLRALVGRTVARERLADPAIPLEEL